jgi:hypothetical protein
VVVVVVVVVLLLLLRGQQQQTRYPGISNGAGGERRMATCRLGVLHTLAYSLASVFQFQKVAAPSAAPSTFLPLIFLIFLLDLRGSVQAVTFIGNSEESELQLRSIPLVSRAPNSIRLQ